VTAVVVRTFVHERMADYAVPRHVRIVDETPRNKTGKIEKDLLRSAHRRAAGSAALDAQRTPPRSGGQNPPPPARIAPPIMVLIVTVRSLTAWLAELA
jgi:hypothetical protein